MTTTELRIMLQLSRKGMAVVSESISPEEALAAWGAIAALQREFTAAMNVKNEVPANG